SRLWEHALGLVAQAEQSFLASGEAARFGYRQYFIRAHIRLHAGLRIGADRAIAAIVAAKVRGWNEDLPGVADRTAFEAIPNGGGRLQQSSQRSIVHQRKRIFAGNTNAL